MSEYVVSSSAAKFCEEKTLSIASKSPSSLFLCDIRSLGEHKAQNNIDLYCPVFQNWGRKPDVTLTSSLADVFFAHYFGLVVSRTGDVMDVNSGVSTQIQQELALEQQKAVVQVFFCCILPL